MEGEARRSILRAMYQTRFHQREETIESRVNDERMRKDTGKGFVNEDRAATSS